LKMILPESVRTVQTQPEWGQEIFLDTLTEHIRKMVRIALETAMKQELDVFLGYNPYERDPEQDNSRNGYYHHSLDTRFGKIENIAVPRDRKGKFQSRVRKYEPLIR